MWLTRLSIQRPVFVIVLMASFLVMGFFSRARMQVEERPRVDIPYVTITTTYPGTGPSEMESLITKPLEDSVSGVNNIRQVTSSSQYGISFVQLEFVVGTNSQFAAQEVRQKVDGARKLLPKDVDPPVVDRFDINAIPILYMGLQGDQSSKQLRFLADHEIKYRLSQVEGVGKIDVTGGEVREIQVLVDKQRLQAFGLALNDVVSALYQSNANVPSGHITEGSSDYDARLIGGSLLAVLVVFLFLHNLRGMLICAIAIPTSLVATFIPMYFLGQTLNSMTMLGLSLVVGILVDDSIVVLENIYRHLQRGEPPREAAFNGRTEIGLAAITITMVDVVVFLPMLWMGGIIGMFFRAFGLTVAVSTLFSLLVSFTVTPWLASRWYKLGEDLESRRGVFRWLEIGLEKLDHGYRRLLGGALRYRWHVVVSGFGLLVLVVMWAFPPNAAPRLKVGYFTSSDQGMIAATLELPEGKS